jgi:hypothetical protein
VEKMSEYISISKVLNHIDFSGMGLTKDYILQLAQAMSNSDCLIAVHLNDTGFARDPDMALEVLDMFIWDTKDIFKGSDEYDCYKNRRI